MSLKQRPARQWDNCVCLDDVKMVLHDYFLFCVVIWEIMESSPTDQSAYRRLPTGFTQYLNRSRWFTGQHIKPVQPNDIMIIVTSQCSWTIEGFPSTWKLETQPTTPDQLA